MHISYHPVLLPDVEYCLGSMLPRGFACEPDLLHALPKLWYEWIRSGSATMIVVGTRDAGGRERRVAFGMSVFVTEEFAAELLAARIAPPVAASLSTLSLADADPDAGMGPFSAVLTPAQVRHANAVDGPGLNLLSPAIGWLPDIAGDAELLPRIKAKLLEALVAMHTGYKLKRFLQEIYSEAEMKRGAAVGATVFTDYAEHCGSRVLLPEERAYLVGVERDTVAESSTLWPLFLYTPPIIFFTRPEQEVLQLASMGLTDPQIAETLNVSPSTVHKRWHALLRRAAAHAGVWMPNPPTAAAGREKGGRGAEKRRFLLNYLKSHPEELRPSSPAARRVG